MCDDEALREALLEINHLRAREAAALREANALLRGIQRMNTAPNPGAALVELLHSIAATMACDCVAVVRDHGGDATFRPVVGGTLGPCLPGVGATFTKKSRLVLDLALTTWWTGEAGPYRSLALVPIAISGEAAAIACFSLTPGAFTKADIALLTRLSELSAQALAAHELSERNALLAAVIDGSPVAIAIADANRDETPLIYVNDAFVSLTGYERQEVLGRNCGFLTAEAPDSPEREGVRRAVAENEIGGFELINKRRDGTPYFVELTLYPVQLSGGRRYLVAGQIDSTARRATERERDQARHRMEAALSEASEGFLIVDKDGEIVLANAPWRSFFAGAPCGWSEGRRFVDVWAERLMADGLPRGAALADAEARLAGMRFGRSDREETLPDGRIVLLSETPFGGGQVVCIATDVTRIQRSKRELALRAAAIEAVQEGLAITDEAGRFLYMSPTHLAMFGYEAYEVLGRKWTMLYSQENFERLLRHVIPVLERDGAWRGELIGRHKSGAPVEQELSLSLVSGAGLVCMTRDIGVRKRQEAENMRLREQLNAAQRQEAIGVIAAGIAHDFNNVIAAIGGSATLIVESENINDHDRAQAVRILRASERARNLVGRLLDFGKRRSSAHRIDLTEVLSEASELIAASVTGAIDVTLEVPDEDVPAVIDSTDFLQIVLNFVINGRDAIDGGSGHLTVTMLEEGAPDAFGEVVIGTVGAYRYAALTVEDDGAGIAPERLRTIFEPYVSTKGKDGTGLGLAVVAGLVREANGLIAIRSNVGEGTAFTLLLPRADDPAAAAGPPSHFAAARPGAGFALPGVPVPHGASHAPAAPAPAAAAASDAHTASDEHAAPATPCAMYPDRPAVKRSAKPLAGKLVLVVDDDVDAGETTATVLERLGAEVAQCINPEDALEAVREDPGAWDALVTDFEMPNLDGGRLAAAVRALRPSLPCVCVTGRGDLRNAKTPFSAVLTKPVSPADLAAAVAAALTRNERVLQ